MSGVRQMVQTAAVKDPLHQRTDAARPAVQVVFRDMHVVDSAESLCWAETERLERYSDGIISCRVVIVQESHRGHPGGFDVRIDLSLARAEVVVNRESGDRHVEEDVHAAISAAFDKARRRLETLRGRRHAS